MCWYENYVKVLRRCESGQTPGAVVGFCGGGGSAEGVRRAGGAVVGVDLRVQEDFKRRFGETAFVEADATCREKLRALRDRWRACYAQMSPPCKYYSTLLHGTASEPPLINTTRTVLSGLFDYYSIENVMGASWAMGSHAVELDGTMFGLRVLRSRLHEANFPIHVDRALKEGGAQLRARCCLGARRRWRPLDEFGRAAPACCNGNVFCVVGKHPLRCTTEECADRKSGRKE